MKNIAKIILLSILGVMLVVALALGIGGNRRNMSKSKCAGIKIEVIDSSDAHFVTPERILKLIDKEYGGYKNVPLGHISLGRIEKILGEEGMLEEYDAYFTPDAYLHVRIKQYTPAIKIKGEDGLHYICNGGKYFKVSDDWCENIPIVKGKIQQDDKWLQRMCSFGDYLSDNKELMESIERMGCDSHGEVSIKFKEGKEILYFGQPMDMKKKMKKVETYFKKIVPALEEGKHYKSVNLKYDNQIVCK